jgi:hypothetical protein
VCKCNPLMRTPFSGKPGCKQPVTVTIDPEKLIIVTENHGGHKGGHCIASDAAGWIDKLEHMLAAEQIRA